MCSISRGKFATVYKSLSKCIFENLAFEEYLFRNHDVNKNGELLLFWSNNPAIVVGRHQNTWAEVNLEFAKKNRIDVARRHSGGGTVYHDLGNLNISLLTTHAQHCRPKNLKFISEALNDTFSLSIVPNKRDDMELQPGNRKCSGTAARIARGHAYHHLTLLVDADLSVLSAALNSPLRHQIVTNATKSVRAEAVGFLRQDDRSASVVAAEKAVVEAYRSQFEASLYDEIDVGEQIESNSEMARIYEQLIGWEWIFGKSPRFVFTDDENREILVKDGVVATRSGDFDAGTRFVL
ncbi:unnamed protein product [Caenorhabditis bovis]|uniref:BPL/LPL catalytic domain-containing protein n=1 Tax=Caenorhabditis bovis TaxID=2654633 RepID=A0A8S1FA14_9PELO|nr:unnamed protein product [Caenorhabditis bovis]